MYINIQSCLGAYHSTNHISHITQWPATSTKLCFDFPYFQLCKSWYCHYIFTFDIWCLYFIFVKELAIKTSTKYGINIPYFFLIILISASTKIDNSPSSLFIFIYFISYYLIYIYINKWQDRLWGPAQGLEITLYTENILKK